MLRLATILKVYLILRRFRVYDFKTIIILCSRFIVTLRRFIGKLLSERQVDQLIASDVFANNAADVPAGMHGDQSRRRSDP